MLKNLPLRLFQLMLVLLFALGNGFCYESELAIKLVDVSADNSPIRVSGQVMFSENNPKAGHYSYSVNASASNVSDRSILLMIIDFQANGRSGWGYHHISRRDYFFEPNLLKPEAVENVDQPPLSYGLTSTDDKTDMEGDTRLEPKAIAKVEFVQFEDGSIWGDKDSALDALDNRAQTLHLLNILEQTYIEAGEPEFLNKLATTSGIFLIDALKSACKEKGSSNYFDCTHNGIVRLLETAKKYDRSFCPALIPFPEGH